MIANKEVEKLEKSSAKLTITVGNEDSANEYKELIDKYAKTAQIKGFRKGKVPAAVLEQKFGESIRGEAAMNIIEKSLQEAFEEIEERPLQFSPPELKDEPELTPGEDFTFSVVYDIYPDIKIGTYKGLEIERPVVTVGKEDIDRELAQIQDQNSIVQDKKDGIVAEENIVTVNYEELDESGTTIEGTERQDFVFTVGSGYNLYKIDEDIVGMKIDEEKEIEKEYPDDFEVSDLAGQKKKLKVKVTAVKEKQLPELDDELAQDVSDEYETLDDLKKHIEKRLKDAAEARVRQNDIQALLDQIIEGSEIELPESMIQAELDMSWRSFVMQSRMTEDQVAEILKLQDRTKENLYTEWQPEAEKNIRRRLLMNTIVEEEKIEIADNELEDEIKSQAEQNNMSVEEVKENLAKNNGTEYLRSDLLDRKLYDFLLENASVKKGKKTKFLDLMQENQ